MCTRLPMLFVLLVLAASLFAGDTGVEIVANDEGVFLYVEDFETAGFARDAFLTKMPLEAWSKGRIAHKGPDRHHVLTYRFHGDRAVDGLDLQIEQSANRRHLGGVNRLYVSANGLDWALADSSEDQEGDGNAWQSEPLTVPQEAADNLLGHREIWIRLDLDNHSGLKTAVSNWISNLSIELTLGSSAGEDADPQAHLRDSWGQLREKEGWKSIDLDWADPPSRRPPHYYEDSDGWLRQGGEVPWLAPEEGAGFPVRRSILHESRSPLSMAMFVETDQTPEPLMARLIVSATEDSSRQMQVSWDGQLLGTFDVASYFQEDRSYLVEIPGSIEKGIHELRVACRDEGMILVRRITMAGHRSLAWTLRPTLPEGGSMEVLSAYYMPDPSPPADSQAVEGRNAKKVTGFVFRHLQRFYEDHGDFGALRVLIRNTGSVPIRLQDPLCLDGKPLAEHYVDFRQSPWDDRGVVWHRIRPRLLQPNETGEIYIRFRRRPAGDGASLRIPMERGEPVEIEIPYSDPSFLVDYVTTDETRRRLFIYGRRAPGGSPGRITEASLDGEVLENVEVFGPDFPGNVAMAVAELPAALDPMERHVVGLGTSRGESLAASFRVLPFVFPRSSIHVPPERAEEMNMNLLMWHEHDLETCEKYGMPTSSMSVFDRHEGVAFILGPDEPDAHDNRGGGYDVGLGYNARRLAQNGWQTLIEQHSPQAASWIIMNGTTRPLNWAVYGQLADITCFDPYPVNFYGSDCAMIRESLSLTRQCGAPKRMYACLEAFGWSAGQGVPDNRRAPLPAEYRQSVVQAIGAGMKGLTSWVYSAGAGGWQLDEAGTTEIARCNALIAHIENHLLLGTPIDLASSDAGLIETGTAGEEHWEKDRVWVGALLCGPDALVIAACNHIPASKPAPPVIEPAQDVTLTVELPKYLTEVSAFEVTEKGIEAYPSTVKGRRARLPIDTMESGRVFLLKRREREQ